jgi:hypothetical protein
MLLTRRPLRVRVETAAEIANYPFLPEFPGPYPWRCPDTAERLFAAHGYSGTSLRAIITEAEVNQAAVNYYFRSKEALLEAVFLRRTEPTNQERMEMLERCEPVHLISPPKLTQKCGFQ